MATVPPEQWRAFNEYLDQALDLPEADRAAWLAALAQSSPELAAAVADALSQRERTGYAEFLAEPLLPPYARSAWAMWIWDRWPMLNPRCKK